MSEEEEIDAKDLLALLPAMDIWLDVNDNEIHHVAHLLPHLDWTGGALGVRMRVEPKDIAKLVGEFRLARKQAREAVATADKKKPNTNFSVWPTDFLQFLDKRMPALVEVRSYVLDPDKRGRAEGGVAQVQELPDSRLPLDRDPWKGLIRIDEIGAQRHLSDASPSTLSSDDDADHAPSSRRRLSEQLRSYYNRHLDPTKAPTEADIDALVAIHSAEQTFDDRLKQHFNEPIKELEGLGYPGIADPKVTINTRFRPTDGLQHHSAVQYEVAAAATGTPLRLPEDYSGLGYQNLISMVFMLMSFRDDWLQVGKRALRDPGDEDRSAIPPLHRASRGA